MNTAQPKHVDVVIFGGGVAGLWLLDDLRRVGYSVLLLEAHALGSGQTVASQGILHGGLKYTLSNLIDPGARAVAKMPELWRNCLAGKEEPNLSGTAMRSDFCYLWNTGSTRSKLGMTGAKNVLRVTPTELQKEDWPDILKPAATSVYKLNEQVIRTRSFIEVLAERNKTNLVKVDGSTVSFEKQADGYAITADALPTIHAKQIVLCAGEGNAELRSKLGLSESVMQRRPLHMVMLRGDMPALNGHCTDFSKTRITVTSDTDITGNTIWQIGGQVSEDGVDMDEASLIAHTRKEVIDILPDLNLSNCAWSTYRVNRAEHTTRGGLRPGGVTVLKDENVITAWPTKLVLAPQLAADVRKKLDKPSGNSDKLNGNDLPRPTVAPYPWETASNWIDDASVKQD